MRWSRARPARRPPARRASRSSWACRRGRARSRGNRHGDADERHSRHEDATIEIPPGTFGQRPLAITVPGDGVTDQQLTIEGEGQSAGATVIDGATAARSASPPPLGLLAVDLNLEIADGPPRGRRPRHREGATVESRQRHHRQQRPNGGGIYDDGTLTIENSLINSNQATRPAPATAAASTTGPTPPVARSPTARSSTTRPSTRAGRCSVMPTPGHGAERDDRRQLGVRERGELRRQRLCGRGHDHRQRHLQRHLRLLGHPLDHEDLGGNIDDGNSCGLDASGDLTSTNPGGRRSTPATARRT